ncbi:phosphotransferase enzyme family protein [Catellatospora bangladeshensis]|uniref:phosphotransferase enzyme family protein n=1 Tax=Catellatospora bangladeshensis TaxID=310355 RepID=UPI0019413588|nr:phosphotransferase [Catellatospora bangladeshensis]
MDEIELAALTTFGADEALAVVRRALAGTRFADADLTVLRPPADNAVVAVPAAGLVARVGAVRARRERLRTELELATWCESRGIQTVRPAGSPPTEQLLQVDGRIVTWWQYLPTAERGTAQALGRLLRQLHRQPPPWPDLPPLNPWNRVRRQLSAAASGIPAADLAGLVDLRDELDRRWSASRWPAEPSAILHGDAHVGNTLSIAGQVHLLDFEDSCLGPRQWDIAYVIGSWRLGWLTDAEFDQFVAAYGDDLRDDADIDLLVDISLFRRTCWYASRASREPQIVDAVRHRIATLLDPSLRRDWRRS